MNWAPGETANPQKAFGIVRRTKSIEGAKLITEYCVANHDYRGAVEFLLMVRLRFHMPPPGRSRRGPKGELNSARGCVSAAAS